MKHKTSIGTVGKKVIVSAFGGHPMDAVENHLMIEDQAPPAPSTLGTNDVIIGIKSAAVGWVDLLMSSGQYQHMASPPYCPGLEYSGVILWTGKEVSPKEFSKGAAVLSDPFLTGPRSKGAYQRYGGFASYAVAPKEALYLLPEGFSFDQGCSFLGSYETAYHCLVACGNLQKGETVLIHGASGATGLAAVQVAKLLGATVIATGRSIDKLEEVRKQGADHIICLQNTDGTPGIRKFRDEVKALTEGRGVDVVYDGVGGDISIESLRCVSFGARFLIVGWAATPFVAKGKGQRGAPKANQLPTNLIMMKGLHVIGCPTFISTHNNPAIRKERLLQLWKWLKQKKIFPYVSQTFSLSQVKEAMQAKWRGQCIGTCVIHPEAHK